MWLEEFLRDVVAGTVAGSCGIVVGHPLDCVKVRLQTSSSGAASVGAGGVVRAAREMMRDGGARAFFRGLASPVAANAPINAIVFAAEGGANRWLERAHPELSPPFAHALAGSAAGLAQVPVSCPSELVKVQMQVQPSGAGARRWASSWQCARAIVEAHGAGALYRGLGLTLTRDTLSWGVYFGVYDLCKSELAARQRRGEGEGGYGHGHGHGRGLEPPAAPAPLPLSALMLSGGLAGVASWLSLHPVDVLKSIQQGAGLALPPAERSVAALWRASAAAHGGHGFLLRGLGTTLVRAFPTSAITFPIFEACVAAIDTWRSKQDGAAASFRAERARVAARVGASAGTGEFDAEPEAASGGHR
jgi:solute carrier family 25 carnitine/acylcarnitine transporter 20/29